MSVTRQDGSTQRIIAPKPWGTSGGAQKASAPEPSALDRLAVQRLLREMEGLDASSGQPSSLRRRTVPQPEIRFAGERFELDREGEEVYIRHARWSLLGSGVSVAEALIDLISEAHELRSILLSKQPSHLSAEARRMLDFLIRI